MGWLFGILWLYTAACLGLCFTFAPWMQRYHAGALILLATIPSLLAGLTALRLLVRSYRHMGSQRRPWLVLAGGLAALLTPIGLSFWAVWGSQCVGQNSPMSFFLSRDVEFLCSELLQVIYFEFHRNLALCFAAATALAALPGFLCWRLLKEHSRINHYPRLPVLATLLLSCVAMPLLTFGGLELTRRQGTNFFFYLYQEPLLACAKELARIEQPPSFPQVSLFGSPDSEADQEKDREIERKPQQAEQERQHAEQLLPAGFTRLVEPSTTAMSANLWFSHWPVLDLGFKRQGFESSCYCPAREFWVGEGIRMDDPQYPLSYYTYFGRWQELGASLMFVIPAVPEIPVSLASTPPEPTGRTISWRHDRGPFFSWRAEPASLETIPRDASPCNRRRGGHSAHIEDLNVPLPPEVRASFVAVAVFAV